ncbi:PAS domain S-box protein [Methylococcus sp. EFPC2]|uniref:sensor histidine kinase n=1 Tax=Methylococcus sp. EFPC2 TaxID=2812648 RepID=UPI001967F167|nr:PAS domain S-box protein [Methylococcus sp. EFPC2]QSA96173.1 PAS domain S-box protein [Methylococcus sp. EFPC2]
MPHSQHLPNRRLSSSVPRSILALILIAAALSFASELRHARNAATLNIEHLLDTVELSASLAAESGDRELGIQVLERLLNSGLVVHAGLDDNGKLHLHRSADRLSSTDTIVRLLNSKDRSPAGIGRLTVRPSLAWVIREALPGALLGAISATVFIVTTAWLVLRIVRSSLQSISNTLRSMAVDDWPCPPPPASHRGAEASKLLEAIGGLLDLVQRRLQKQPVLLGFSLNLAREAAYLIGPQGQFQYVNDEACRLLGYTREELLARGIRDIAPDYPAERWASHWSELQTRGALVFETRHRAKDGHIFPVEVAASYLEHEGLTYNLALARDITERKAEEKALMHYAAIIASSDDAIIGKTLDGIVTSWNAGAERMFGYRAAEAQGRHITFLIPAPYWDEEKAILGEISRGRSVNHYETVRSTKDGHLIDVSVTVSPLRDGQGKVVGAAKIVRDITERKKSEEELRKHREHLEELVARRTAALEAANRELEAFSYSVSHDLRTPLRAIDGFSRMLAKKYEAQLDPEAQRLIKVVRGSAARMSQLIDDILAFSRAGRLELRLAPVDMAQLVRTVWLDLEPLRADRDICLEIRPLPPALGDPTLLRQVWTNLLANAVKFTLSRATAHITVGGTTDGATHLYHVQDDGVGFEPAYVHKLFGVFQRLHGVEEFEGTGIGLAIVKRVVTRHGGRVWAEGNPGQGATFKFALPARPPANADFETP